MPENPDAMEQIFQKMSDQVFGELQKCVEPLVDSPWTEIRQEIEGGAESIKHENAHRVIDAPSRMFLHTCSLFLAGYRVILPLIDDRDKVLDIMSRAMSDRLREDIESYLVDRFDITQDAPEQAYEKMRVNFKGFGEVRFGRTFVYEQEDRGQSQCTVSVRKCFFNEFFSENGAPELTPTYCVQDVIWMDEVNKPKYGVKATRSSIIAEGGDSCSFHFTKVD